MVHRDELEGYLSQWLNVDSFNDYAPNGLQIEGKESIRQLCTAVTASQSVIDQAIKLGADALLVHHGYFWKGEVQKIKGIKKKRIAALIKHDLNLFAYHLPLDCHPQIGNNACLMRLLDVECFTTHAAGNINEVLWYGSYDKAQDPVEFCNQLSKIFNRPPLHLGNKDRPIRRLAWCSGGAQDFIEEAARLGADAYLSGEVSERTYYQAEELGIHYFACGHHATERYGIQALGEHLASNFDLTHQFIDSPNPV